MVWWWNFTKCTTGIYVNSPSSSLVGKIITKASFTIKKNSATALTGTFTCEILKANFAGFITLGTIYNCSALTQSDQVFTFLDRNQTYALQNGDRVRLKVNGGNTTSTDYIMINHTLTDVAQGGVNEEY